MNKLFGPLNFNPIELIGHHSINLFEQEPIENEIAVDTAVSSKQNDANDKFLTIKSIETDIKQSFKQ